MPGAGGHHPDQAERTHRGSAQSRRHRQHHHAGGHSLRNELLHRTVDPPQEIQTHHQYLLRSFTSSKKHTSKISYPLKKRKCLHTYKYLHTHLGQIKHWAGERSSRRERSSLFLRRQNAGLFEEYFCTFCLVVSLSLLLFQFLSHLRFLNDAVVTRSEGVKRV